MRLRRVGRPAIVVVVTAVCLGLTVVPAGAHGGGPDSTYYRTQLTGLVPQLSDVSMRVDPAGEWIELTYTGVDSVIVLGYLGEPYLRVTATSVEENTLSQTTYLNEALFADVPTGTSAAAVVPSWRTVAGSGTARWHDHRIHWMGQTRPPVVAADPTHPHTVGDWAVHAAVGSTPFDIRGTIEWRGRPGGISGTVWVILGLVNIPLFAMALVVMRAQRRRPTRS